MRRVFAAALLVLSPVAAFAESEGRYTTADGHMHQKILFFGPGTEADCVALRNGKEIFRQHSPWDKVPIVDADITESQDDILLTCTRADQTQVSLTLHWSTYLTLEGDRHGGPASCSRPYRLEEEWPNDCWVSAQISYPLHVQLRFGETR